MTKARILIADDHDLARSGIISVLSGAPDLEVVAEARDGLEAITLAAKLLPDIALLDVRMTPMDGLAAAAEIRRVSPSTRIMMLTMHDSLDYLEAAVKAGASGYALKDVRRDTLLRMIRAVLDGQEFFDTGLVRRMLTRVSRTSPAEDAISQLTTREREILQEVARGATNKEIARRLSIAPGTVKVHVERIIAKLRVGDRTQAAVLAAQAGLVEGEAS
ncbi:response regulator transcription factor [Agrobacterium vitis]|uniref:Response regulator transcription factor n=1 Tax=Agrobacterium vitis TaxID=373 RepID=A0AAE2R9X5_AGRVI|nr:response regulator transcription factor [Agrobacterium vitis]MBF2713699.1 response regulator transcription factor [Agrobacterium vitis]MUZ62825.1 response regulator [Agrobacterium vitis]MVA18759.1 response regulator [Agrobacterium vitis]